MLNRKSQQNQIRTLTTEVGELQEINKTLKTYLEAVLTSVKPESEKLIKTEDKRLSDATLRKELEKNDWIEWSMSVNEISLDENIRILAAAKDFDDYINLIGSKKTQTRTRKTLRDFQGARDAFNQARAIMGLTTFEELPSEES